MSTSPPRTWTLDQVIVHGEHQGKIVPPFTPDERSLALAVAEAYHFAFELAELPARAPHHSLAHMAMFWGVRKVRGRRKPTSPGTKD